MIVGQFEDVQGVEPAGIFVGLTYRELQVLEHEHRVVAFPGNEHGPPVMVLAAASQDDILALIREYAVDLRGEERAQ